MPVNWLNKSILYGTLSLVFAFELIHLVLSHCRSDKTIVEGCRCLPQGLAGVGVGVKGVGGKWSAQLLRPWFFPTPKLPSRLWCIMHTYWPSAACRGSRTGVNKCDSFVLVSQVKTRSKDYLNRWHTDLRALAHPSDTVASSFVIPEGLHSTEGPGQGYLSCPLPWRPRCKGECWGQEFRNWAPRGCVWLEFWFGRNHLVSHISWSQNKKSWMTPTPCPTFFSDLVIKWRMREEDKRAHSGCCWVPYLC